jgi:hypothetical protein
LCVLLGCGYLPACSDTCGLVVSLSLTMILLGCRVEAAPGGAL